MAGVRLILALHDHQPVGNFEGVFEAAYRDSYRPFLDVLEGYPDIPFVLHTSGPLLEWLVGRHPDYVARVRDLVEAGRVEVLGGPFFEPILTMIPPRDRVGQVRDYSAYLHEVFGQVVRGIWVPERVWEPGLVASIAEAGVEYTILDDYHFQRSGLADDELFGYYLTEDDGQLLKVFPAAERLRYLIPFQEPHATYEYLRRLAAERPGATVVFADDGEKFGSWPGTSDHVYRSGWLRRFCDMLRANRDWIRPTTLARAVDSTLPLGKVSIPESSYREMTEWALPTSRSAAYREAVRRVGGDPAAERLRPFVQPGGSWRNFKAKYPESDEMYARMLGVSRRLAGLGPEADPDYREVARQELYRGQCNCSYWHGAFGGLYLPHLRNAIYQHLIAAHNALDDAEGKQGPRVELEVGDFNLDARQEARLENDRLIAFLRPATGGHVYELDDRSSLTNVLATLERRPEPYHAAIRGGQGHAIDGPAVLEKVVLKQEGLDRLLVYDQGPRKALVDHFYPLDVRLDDLRACLDVERGDFARGAYLARVQRSPGRVALTMERPGRADGHAIRICKEVGLRADSPTLDVHYVLKGLPTESDLHFAVEFNIAAMAGHAPDRSYRATDGTNLGMLDAHLDLPEAEGLTLADAWLDLAADLRWSEPAGVWAFPIETVSQSESGFEGLYQGSVIIPHWRVRGDESGQWEVRISWTLDRARAALEAGRPEVEFAGVP